MELSRIFPKKVMIGLGLLLVGKIIIRWHKRHTSLARKMTMKWLEPPPGDNVIA